MNVFFGFRLPNDLKKYLQEQAKRNRTSMSHYIVMLIDRDKNEGDKNEQIKNRVS